MADFDWNDLRAFLAVVRTGRLTAAAVQLGVEHSTLSRRIKGLEQALRVRLFDRRPSDYVLTEAGEKFIAEAEAIESLTIKINSKVADLRISNVLTQVQATLAGGGYCILPAFIASEHRELARVLPQQVRVIRAYWLVMHSELRAPARARATIDFMNDAVRRDRHVFMPGASAGS